VLQGEINFIEFARNFGVDINVCIIIDDQCLIASRIISCVRHYGRDMKFSFRYKLLCECVMLCNVKQKVMMSIIDDCSRFFFRQLDQSISINYEYLMTSRISLFE